MTPEERQQQETRQLHRFLRRALTEIAEQISELRDLIPLDPEPEERDR